MPHVTISDVENGEYGVEKRFSHTFFFSRLEGKVDKNLSYFFSGKAFVCCTQLVILYCVRENIRIEKEG